MATRQHKNTAQYSPLPLPLVGTEQVEVWRDGKQYQTTLSVLGGNPGPHGESHESGTDKIGTQTPTADAIVRGDDNGQVNDWVADASTSVKGKVQLAAHNEEAANKVMQSDDPRNKNARPPTAHAASHLGGSDDLGLGTSALLDVGVADGVCPLNSSGEVSATFIRNADNTQAAINGATAKATPVDADVFGFLDSVASFVIKKCTWANIKATLKAYFDTIYGTSSLTLGTTSTTAYRGDRGKIAYDHSQTAHAPSNADNTQGAINGAVGETSVAGNDRIPFIDNGSGGALKTISIDDFADAIGGSSGGGSMSVDNTSRVAEYTGDGIPLIPDNAAGTTFIRDGNWTDPAGWSVSEASRSYAFGRVVLTATAAKPQIYMSVASYVGKAVVVKVKKTSGGSSPFRIYVGGAFVYEKSITAGLSHTATYYISPSATGVIAFVFILSNVGDTYEIEALYIGTGAYDTPAKDRAGNGNGLALTAVTPVDGKYGKEMSFNGSTSFAQAPSLVIGTGGTIAIRFKRGSLGIEQGLFSTTNATGNGLGFSFNTSNVLRLVFSNGTTMVGSGTKVFNSTNVFSSVVVNSSGQVFYDGVLSTDTVPTSWVIGLRNLLLGTDATNFFNGIISHFRYDSRVWTAAEALAWSMNPLSIDSRVKSDNENVYNMGGRVVSYATLTSGFYVIPKGEYYLSVLAAQSSSGMVQIQVFESGSAVWKDMVSFVTASGESKMFSYGYIKSDGEHVAVKWLSGTLTVTMIKVG